MSNYSEFVDKYSKLNCNRFIIPDYVMEKDGVACGDYVMLSGENNNGIIEFCFYVEGCELCNAAANYLSTTYNDKPLKFVMSEISEKLNKIKSNPSSLLEFYGVPQLLGRYNCLLFPYEMLYSFVSELSVKVEEEQHDIDTLQNLDCDACAVASDVSWGNKEKSSDKEKNTQPQKKEPEYPLEYKKNWGMVSKAYLNPSEIELLKKLVSTVTFEDHEYLRKKKIAQCVFGNMCKYNIPYGENSIWKDIMYRIHRKRSTRSEFERVYNFIKESNLKLYKVKGAHTSELYSDDGIRVHLDYDFVATDIKDAFILAKYLLNNGYKISAGLFSIKRIAINDKNGYSGHFHLEKVINSRYKIIVDVNFPGFPMGRIDYFVPEVKGSEILPEDQLIITLCHAYKHKDVYMKDINDIYMMIKNVDLDFADIGRKLEANNLIFFASILFGFIFKNYDLSEEKKDSILSCINFDKDHMYCYENWPYDFDEAFQIKKKDLENRLAEGTDYTRVYLQPLFVFDDKIGNMNSILNRLDEKEIKYHVFDSSLAEILKEYGKLYICEVGVFIDVYSVDGSLDRSKAKSDVLGILNALDVDTYNPIPYSLDYLANWYF